ncbi:MAG: signal peptidase I [Lentisphaeria bacterium]|jgi:signal peptidase I
MVFTMVIGLPPCLAKKIKQGKTMKNRLKTLWTENRTFILFIALMIVFRSALADWNEVPTGSMKPTIVEGDRIWVNKLAYDLRIPFTHFSLLKRGDPKRGDIVVFDSEVSDKRLVKRVVGIPGDTIRLEDNVLYINGFALDYQEISVSDSSTDKREDLLGVKYVVRVDNSSSQLSSFSAVVVPVDHYLAMGDNRDNSADSRVIGFVPRNEIIGRTKSVVLSFNYDNYYIPRSDRFFIPL